MTVNPKEVKAVVRVAGTVKRRVWHDFSRQHVQAAAFFADCATRVEQGLPSARPIDETTAMHHCAYVVGAIVSATMGLDSHINALYVDAREREQQLLRVLDDRTVALLEESSAKLEKSHAGTLRKYQCALLVLGKDTMKPDEQPYRDAASLTQLRNALTHYVPERDDALREHADLQARLEGRFAVNPLSPNAHLWFPHRCLGSGCAKWAVSTAETFVSTFCARLGIASRVPPDSNAQVTP